MPLLLVVLLLFCRAFRVSNLSCYFRFQSATGFVTSCSELVFLEQVQPQPPADNTEPPYCMDPSPKRFVPRGRAGLFLRGMLFLGNHRIRCKFSRQVFTLGTS